MESDDLYTIYDCYGVEMPLKNGKYRTFEEVVNLTERLNYNGEYAPYTFEKIN